MKPATIPGTSCICRGVAGSNIHDTMLTDTNYRNALGYIVEESVNAERFVCVHDIIDTSNNIAVVVVVVLLL